MFVICINRLSQDPLDIPIICTSTFQYAHRKLSVMRVSWRVQRRAHPANGVGMIQAESTIQPFPTMKK